MKSHMREVTTDPNEIADWFDPGRSGRTAADPGDDRPVFGVAFTRSPAKTTRPNLQVIRVTRRGRSPRVATNQRTRGSRRKAAVAAARGAPEADADESDPARGRVLRKCRCGNSCRPLERTCARCRKRRQRKRQEARESSGWPRQAATLSEAEAAYITKRVAEVERLEGLMRAAPGDVRCSSAGAVIA